MSDPQLNFIERIQATAQKIADLIGAKGMNITPAELTGLLAEANDMFKDCAAFEVHLFDQIKHVSAIRTNLGLAIQGIEKVLEYKARESGSMS